MSYDRNKYESLISDKNKSNKENLNDEDFSYEFKSKDDLFENNSQTILSEEKNEMKHY